MKAQELPISTIIIIVIVLVALVAILLFFFTSFGQGQGGVEEQNKFSNCQAICTQINSRNPTDESGVLSAESTFGFCTNNCDQYISCVVDSASCKLGCAPRACTTV